MKKSLLVLLLAILITSLTLALASCSVVPPIDDDSSLDNGESDENEGGSEGGSDGGSDSESVHTHSPAQAVMEKVTEPTCFTKGSYDEVIYCSGCGEELERSNKESEKLSHEFDSKVCIHCDEPKFSEGLWIDPNGDGTAHLYGIGSCTDTDIVIPSRSPDGEPVTRIRASAFKNLENVTSITIPDTVVKIELHAFEGCTSLKSMVIPDSVTSISGNLFYGCTSLTEVTLGCGIKEIPSCMFYGCESLTSVTIPDGVTIIDGSAFYGCKSIKNISIPESVKSISYQAFTGCFALESIKLPDGLTFLGDAFTDCLSLKEIILPDGITVIKSGTFYGCEALRSVRIPIGVTQIEEHAFKGCDMLTWIYYAGSKEQWGQIVIYHNNNSLGHATIRYGGE